MGIIDEYKRIYEEEAIVESKYETAKRVFKKYLCAAWPVGANGTDYSMPKVTHTTHVPDTIEIEQARQEFLFWEREWKDVQAQRERLEICIENLRETEKTILMYRIKGYTLMQIADKMNYSLRWVEIVSSRAEKNLKQIGESSV